MFYKFQKLTLTMAKSSASEKSLLVESTRLSLGVVAEVVTTATERDEASTNGSRKVRHAASRRWPLMSVSTDTK